MTNNFRANATNAIRPGFRAASRRYHLSNGLDFTRRDARAVSSIIQDLYIEPKDSMPLHFCHLVY